MPGFIYYLGRSLQVVGMWALLVAIVIAGPLGPSPRIFGFGTVTFIIGWITVKRAIK